MGLRWPRDHAHKGCFSATIDQESCNICYIHLKKYIHFCESVVVYLQKWIHKQNFKNDPSFSSPHFKLFADLWFPPTCCVILSMDHFCFEEEMQTWEIPFQLEKKVTFVWFANLSQHIHKCPHSICNTPSSELILRV